MVDAAITKGTRGLSSTKCARTGTLNFCFQVSITIAKKIRHLQVCLLRQQPIHLRYQIQFWYWLAQLLDTNKWRSEKNRWTKVGQKLWYDKNGDNLCAKGGAHLDHVFDYGPKPTGVGYCIGRARCACVCVRMPSVFSSSSLQQAKSAITVIKNSLVEIKSTIHYY